MRIKVCGIKFEDNARAIEAISPDLMGFIFYPKSARYVGDEASLELFQNTNKSIKKVGVFVNEEPSFILEIVSKYGLDYVQLHGDETVETCFKLRKKIPVIKAFGVNQNFDFSTLNAYHDAADIFLFDTKTDGYGGSGKKFSWDLLNQYTLDIPFLLSGGIDEFAAEEIKTLKLPQLLGVDLNSRFEISSGLKDIPKLNSFIEKIRN